MKLTDELQAADTRNRIDELLVDVPHTTSHHAIGGRPHILVRIVAADFTMTFHQHPAIDPDEPIPYGTHVHRDIPVDTITITATSETTA